MHSILIIHVSFPFEPISTSTIFYRILQKLWYIACMFLNIVVQTTYNWIINLIDTTNSNALRTNPSCPSYAMCLVFNPLGHIHVKDNPYIWNV